MRPLVFPGIKDDTIFVTTPTYIHHDVTTTVGAEGTSPNRERERETPWLFYNA
jgi:hypothetical protein